MKKSLKLGSLNIDYTYAVKTKAVDTTAAGDAFTGYFLNSVMNGSDPKSVLEHAAKAAAITVSKNGAAESIPMYHEI